jgi:hypothetical protein
MPAVLKIDPRRRIVFSAFYGAVTGEDLLEHRTAIARDPDFNPAFGEIVDFTAVVDVALSEQALGVLASNQSLFDREVLHIIIANDSVVAALAEKFRGMTRATRPNLFVVKTLAEAYDLLANRAGQKRRPQRPQQSEAVS